MTSTGSRPRGIVYKILSSNYFLPVSSVALFLVLGAALYAVHVETASITDQLTGPVDKIELRQIVTEFHNRHLLVEIAMIVSIFGFALLVADYQRRVSGALKKRLTEQERWLTAIVQNSVDAIIFIDNDNRVRMWNRGAEMIFGYTADEMVGRHFYHLVPPELVQSKDLDRIWDEVYQKGHLSNYETQRLAKDGRRVTVAISRTLICDQVGKPVGSAAIVKDVTEKVEMDKHIYNAEKLASIGILAAGVAHEINNPLAIILGLTDLLKERYAEGSSTYEDLEMIESNANHARSIVENLLGFARVTEGLGDVISPASALDTVLKIAKTTLMTKKIEVITDFRENLPPVGGDTREFQQVIFNLITNATAAMEEKGGTLTISAEADDDWLRVHVQDTGTGIPNRIKPRVFDPFFTTKEVGQGTGLGLSLSYGIVQKYGGDLTFESVSQEDSPGRPAGTVFTVSMPVLNDRNAVRGGDG